MRTLSEIRGAICGEHDPRRLRRWWKRLDQDPRAGAQALRVQIEQRSISVSVMPKLTEGQQAMLLKQLAEAQDPPQLAPPSTAPQLNEPHGLSG